MAASMSISAFKQIWKMLPSGKNFDRVFNKINMVAVSSGRCRCEMTVEEEHTNGQGTLHGGFTMSLLDYMTFFTVVTGTSGQMGVSVRANMNFLQSAKVGEKVAMEAELVKAGKTLAFTKADLFNAKGDVIAHGQQTIYIGNNVTIQDMIKSKMEQL